MAQVDDRAELELRLKLTRSNRARHCAPRILYCRTVQQSCRGSRPCVYGQAANARLSPSLGRRGPSQLWSADGHQELQSGCVRGGGKQPGEREEQLWVVTHRAESGRGGRDWRGFLAPWSSRCSRGCMADSRRPLESNAAFCNGRASHTDCLIRDDIDHSMHKLVCDLVWQTVVVMLRGTADVKHNRESIRERRLKPGC